MNKATVKTMNISDLKVNFDLNIRDKANYDLPSIMEQIQSLGRIVKPIIVKEDGTVLSGNRRTLGGQELYGRPDISVELKDALSKVQVLMYKDLSPTEELQLILDHGSEKPISRAEVVAAVWRLDKQFFSEGQIINLMYFALAKYTRNEAKLNTLSADPKVREGELKKWLHGTVGNYMLSAAKMGPVVREQFLLTAKAEDGMLKEGETVKIKMSRDRITALSAAKNGEKDVWTPGEGSPAFNALLEQFEGEDKGDAKEKLSRPTTKELRDKADAFFSPLIRKSLLLAAGEKGEKVADLDKDDDEYKRIAENFRIVRELLAEIRVKSPEVANLIGAVVNGTASEVKNHFAAYVGA